MSAERDVEPAGDRGEERRREAVAGVGRQAGDGERGDVVGAPRRGRVIEHAAEHDASDVNCPAGSLSDPWP